MRQRGWVDPCRRVHACSPSQGLPQAAALLSCSCELKHELLTQQGPVIQTHTVCMLPYSYTTLLRIINSGPLGRCSCTQKQDTMTHTQTYTVGEKKPGKLVDSNIKCYFYNVLHCVCVSHLWKQILRSPSPLPHPAPTLSQQLSVTYCPPCLHLLLPHSLTSAPVPSPASPFPLSTVSLISRCAFPVSAQSPVGHSSLPTTHRAHTRCPGHCWPPPTPWYHLLF